MTVQTPSAPGAPPPSPTRARPSAQPAPGSPSSPGVPVPGAPVLDGAPSPGAPTPPDDLPAPFDGDGFQSFTGPASVRYPAPDVARGFMLLLIALANAPFWMVLLRTRAEVTGADAVWMGLRAALVDHRSYPLFAMLFGFGLATMARRRIEASPRSTAAVAADADPAVAHASAADTATARATTSTAAATARTGAGGISAARRAAPAADARRLIRGRGLWMLVFAAVHGALFMGDIIGAYALIAVVLAGPIAGRGRRTQAVVGGLSAAVCLGYMLYIGWFLSVGGVTVGTAGAAGGGVVGGIAEMLRGPLYPAVSLVLWAGGTMVTILTSLTLPAALLGVRLADTDLLTRPDRHRRALLVGGAAALAVGAVGALPRVLPSLGVGVPARVTVVASALDVATGMVGACGWLALLAAWAGPGAGAPLRGARRLLSAVGRRSMTVYVGQSLLFALVFGLLARCGAPAPHQTTAALIGVAVWAALAGACAWMEHGGRTRGPLEILLRRAVAASARRR
ncbi:DUF418 domain-containing protein [Actinomyces dentalis]|uniref:DUF418 domain-containing protein n=1 Tax=Actinomyces dentalis TaxID=272548 RepID=UPI0028F019C5|nr:DUF418 domain-containing protein [Actinomyces dentalis]